MSPDMNQDQVPVAQQVPMQNPGQQAQPLADLPGPAPGSAGRGQPALPPTQISDDALLPIPPEAVQLQAAGQVTQLITQYGHDPYKLNEALSQLRAGYVADQYHVGPDSSGEGH